MVFNGSSYLPFLAVCAWARSIPAKSKECQAECSVGWDQRSGRAVQVPFVLIPESCYKVDVKEAIWPQVSLMFSNLDDKMTKVKDVVNSAALWEGKFIKVLQSWYELCYTCQYDTCSHFLGCLSRGHRITCSSPQISPNAKDFKFTQKILNILKRFQIYSKVSKYIQKILNIFQRFQIYSKVSKYTQKIPSILKYIFKIPNIIKRL